MHIDPRLEQFTALIEQQRQRQPSMKHSSTAISGTSITPLTGRTHTAIAGTVQNSYSVAAERARIAMAARNPALATKLKQARMNQSNGISGTMKTEAVQNVSVTNRPGRLGSIPITRDLLAIPKRSAAAPGLGQNIDEYA